MGHKVKFLSQEDFSKGSDLGQNAENALQKAKLNNRNKGLPALQSSIGNLPKEGDMVTGRTRPSTNSSASPDHRQSSRFDGTFQATQRMPPLSEGARFTIGRSELIDAHQSLFSPRSPFGKRLDERTQITAGSTPFSSLIPGQDRPSLTTHRPPPHASELDKRLQTIPFTSHLYDYPPQSLRPGGVVYGSQMAMPSYPLAHAIPIRPAKDQDIYLGARSVLLKEFRSDSKSNKRYELKDIYEHVVEFSGDQHGSRFIQTKLETANSDEKEQLFREIQPNALQLMTDVFGNYVIQRLFEHSNQIQKRLLAEQMKNHVMELSMQMYGCRVVQKVSLDST